MKKSSSKSPASDPLLAHIFSSQAGNPVHSWDLEQEGKQAEMFTRRMRPSMESVHVLSDKPHSHSSKAESCFPPSSLPFCCLPLITSQTGKAGAPRQRSDARHFLTGSVTRVLLHPKVADSLPARRSRPHWLHQAQAPRPCRAALPDLRSALPEHGPASGFGSWLERGLCPYLTGVGQTVSVWSRHKQKGK